MAGALVNVLAGYLFGSPINFRRRRRRVSSIEGPAVGTVVSAAVARPVVPGSIPCKHWDFSSLLASAVCRQHMPRMEVVHRHRNRTGGDQTWSGQNLTSPPLSSDVAIGDSSDPVNSLRVSSCHVPTGASMKIALNECCVQSAPAMPN